MPLFNPEFFSLFYEILVCPYRGSLYLKFLPQFSSNLNDLLITIVLLIRPH